MTEIRHLENRHDVIFSAEGGSIWIKFRRLVQNDTSTAVIWSESKPEVNFIWRTFGRIQWHVIPEPLAIVGWKNSIRHIENRFSPYFIFCFLNAVWALVSGGFRVVFDALVLIYFGLFCLLGPVQAASRRFLTGRI